MRCLRTVLLALAAFTVGCAKRAPGPADEAGTVAEKPTPSVRRPKADETDVAGVVEGNNAFAFDLYEKLRGKEGNLIFSPYSISTALAMTYAGARGETASQMETVLHFTLGQKKLHPAMAGLVDDLNRRGGEGAYELVVANRLWGQKGYRFLNSFLALNRTYYGAGLEQVDFAGATEEARRTINAWVEKRTRDKIRELLKPRVLTPFTTLVLTNAIYFKGNWASQFKKEQTKDAPFSVSPTEKVTVPMMRQTKEFGYSETAELQFLEMPYVGDDLSMVVLLPKKIDGLAEIEASLNADGLQTWLSRVHKRKVAVFLPRFKIGFGLDLAKTLESMGMPLAFGGGADFSGMDGTRSLFISNVIHKAFVDVNEEGTEAAAATAVVMSRGVSRPPVFRADRPFLFLIRDRATESILFMGRVVNPKR